MGYTFRPDIGYTLIVSYAVENYGRGSGALGFHPGVCDEKTVNAINLSAIWHQPTLWL
jgi:hypothetical protein